MQAIERIRTALQKHAAAKTLAEAWILADENEDALSVESLTEVLAHIDQLRAEIHASDLAVAEYRQQCLDNAQEIARLRAESEERLQNCVALVAEVERLRKDAERKPMTDDDVRDYVKECGIDWHRGFNPLFDGDDTNRFAVLVRAVEAFHNIKGTS